MNKEKIIEIIWTTIWCITQVVFIVLKLFNIITWSWWWIFAPSWGLIPLLILIIILGVIVIVVYYMSGVMRIYWKHWRGKL